jgi:hypothetical protein
MACEEDHRLFEVGMKMFYASVFKLLAMEALQRSGMRGEFPSA